MVDLLLTAISLQLLQGGMVWVLYLALEPALRSKWPHAIVSWNRLLAGNWNDSLVASQILIGCAAGSCLWVFFAVRDLWTIPSSGLFSDGSALGTNLKTWYAPNGIAAIAILLIVAAWSFQRSLGGRDLLGNQDLGEQLPEAAGGNGG